MSVTIIVGGQFGSEGKGKVSYEFARKLNAAAVVRVGGTNSGHTVVRNDGREFIFRTLPTAAADNSGLCVLPSGSYIDVEILYDEIRQANLSHEKLVIDPYAVLIDDSMKSDEHVIGLRGSIGSTESGTGAAVVKRIQRKGDFRFAKDCIELTPYIQETKPLLRNIIDAGQHVVIEGTQGFGLSPYHADLYPYATSRDTTAAGFLMETGLSPFDVENIVMVIRAYPIRVGGNSGPLPNEKTWELISAGSGTKTDLTELSSATKRIRRVADFDPTIVKKAIAVNKPNIVVMNHLDYIDYSCHDINEPSQKCKEFIATVEQQIARQIDYFGTGKSTLLSAKEV